MATEWQNLTDAIFHFAEIRPDQPAIIEGRRQMTYSALAALIGKSTLQLRERGVNPGDRIGMCMTNSTNHIVHSCALLRAGAALVEMSPRFTVQERADIVRKLSLNVLLVEMDAQVAGGVPNIRVGPGWMEEAAQRPAGDWRYDGAAREPYFIILTSGSTSTPKGAITTHRQYILRCRHSREASPYPEIASGRDPGPLVLTLSVSASTSLRQVWGQFLVGGTVIVLPEYQWIADLIRAIAEWDNAVCAVTPGMCRGFIANATANRMMFPKVHAMMLAGNPINPDEKLRMIQTVTPNFFEGYGSGPIGRISILGPSEITTKADSVGRPIAGVEVEIVDAAGKPLGPNAPGYLRCRSEAVSSGFDNEPDAGGVSEGFRGGWYYPGDRAMIDPEGYIHLKGRDADVIVRRGVEVQAWEVEAVIGSHPSVAEAVVVGRPARDIGEEVVAFLTLRAQTSEQEIEKYCRARLPVEKLPIRYLLMQDLPRTANGKPDRAKIQEFSVNYARQQGLG